MPEPTHQKRAVFSGALSYWITVFVLYILLLWYAMLVVGVGVPSAGLQAIAIVVLLYLLFIRNPLVRLVLQLWSFLTLVFPSVFKIGSKLLIAFGQSGTSLELSTFTVNVLTLLAGCSILLISTRHLRVVADGDAQ